MPHVAALYRYPVKGFTPEQRDALTILPSGRVAGDRVLGFRFASTEEPDDEWSRKQGMVVLMNTPGLARLQVRYDDRANRMAIVLDGKPFADEPLDTEGRVRLATALAGYVLGLDENPLEDHPERLPLRLVGDGVTPRYHDSQDGTVTLHGRGSLSALREALHDPEASELRFRSNVSIEGLDPWEEQTWIGRRIAIGAVEFTVDRPKVRCLATHANPITGVRDHPVMTTLTRAFDQKQPTFAVALIPAGPGEIRIGDEVRVL